MLPKDLPSFSARFGKHEQCRAYLFEACWPEGFRCTACGHDRAWAHNRRLIDECVAGGKQHSLLAGTIFEQTKTGFARWFLGIFLVTSSKGGSGGPWSARRVSRFVSASRPTRPTSAGRNRASRGAALPARARSRPPSRGGRGEGRGRQLGRLRLAVVDDVSAKSLEGFLGQKVARPASVTTDGWSGCFGLEATGYTHEPVNLATSAGDAADRLPAIYLAFGLDKRWLLCTHHGAVSNKHLAAYLDEFTFRFNRRTAKTLGHRFARVIERAAQLKPTTYLSLVHPTSPSLSVLEC